MPLILPMSCRRLWRVCDTIWLRQDLTHTLHVSRGANSHQKQLQSHFDLALFNWNRTHLSTVIGCERFHPFLPVSSGESHGKLVSE